MQGSWVAGNCLSTSLRGTSFQLFCAWKTGSAHFCFSLGRSPRTAGQICLDHVTLLHCVKRWQQAILLVWYIPNVTLSPPEWKKHDEIHFNVSFSCEGHSHKTMSTYHNFWREKSRNGKSNPCPSAYQPNALPLGQSAKFWTGQTLYSFQTCLFSFFYGRFFNAEPRVMVSLDLAKALVASLSDVVVIACCISASCSLTSRVSRHSYFTGKNNSEKQVSLMWFRLVPYAVQQHSMK